jgi:hypothetical protein
MQHGSSSDPTAQNLALLFQAACMNLQIRLPLFLLAEPPRRARYHRSLGQIRSALAATQPRRSSARSFPAWLLKPAPESLLTCSRPNQVRSVPVTLRSYKSQSQRCRTRWTSPIGQPQYAPRAASCDQSLSCYTLPSTLSPARCSLRRHSSIRLKVSWWCHAPPPRPGGTPPRKPHGLTRAPSDQPSACPEIRGTSPTSRTRQGTT